MTIVVQQQMTCIGGFEGWLGLARLRVSGIVYDNALAVVCARSAPLLGQPVHTETGGRVGNCGVSPDQDALLSHVKRDGNSWCSSAEVQGSLRILMSLCVC